MRYVPDDGVQILDPGHDVPPVVEQQVGGLPLQQLDVELVGQVQREQAVLHVQLADENVLAHLLERAHLEVFGRLQHAHHLLRGDLDGNQIHPLEHVLQRGGVEVLLGNPVHSSLPRSWCC